MQSLVIIIILLSLIGLYINLGKVTELNEPELKKEEPQEDKNISIDDIADNIIKEIEVQPEFDEMGNPTTTTDGLLPDKRIINLNVTSGSAPNTKPEKWTAATKKEIGKYGLVKNTLSYKNNFPYDVNYLNKVQTSNSLSSKVSNIARQPKSESFRSQIILPKDESLFKEGYSYTNRAIAIIRNQTANENKILPDVRKIDPNEVTNRASIKINQVSPDEIELKVKPDLLTVQSQNDNSKLNTKKIDLVKHSVNQTKSNYNLK